MTARVEKFRQRLNNHKEHLTERDLDAARRELKGEVFYKTGGIPADHVREVRDSQLGLRKLIEEIRWVFSDLSPERKPSAEEAEQLNQILAEASRLLDLSKRYVP